MWRWISLLAAAGAGAWWWLRRCEADCAAATRDARALLLRGEPVRALALLDRADARCGCARFTAGDEPPEYAVARACLDRLQAEGRMADAADVLARARGPILRELAAAYRQPGGA